MEPQQCRGRDTHNAIIILSCRGHVDGSNYYIFSLRRNHNSAAAGTHTMQLSYCHAVAMLMDPIITYLAYGGTTTVPRQGHTQCNCGISRWTKQWQRWGNMMFPYILCYGKL